MSTSRPDLSKGEIKAHIARVADNCILHESVGGLNKLVGNIQRQFSNAPIATPLLRFHQTRHLRSLILFIFPLFLPSFFPFSLFLLASPSLLSSSFSFFLLLSFLSHFFLVPYYPGARAPSAPWIRACNSMIILL